LPSIKNKISIKEQFKRVSIQDRIGICKTCSKYDKCYTWCYGREYDESIQHIIKKYIKDKIKRLYSNMKGKQ
jgi:hypothetical protein